MSTGQSGDNRLNVVFDTNVIISGIRFGGNERVLLSYGQAGKIVVRLSPFILEEVSGVLRRKFHYSPAAAQAEIDALRQWVNLVEPTVVVQGIARDDDDNHILACSLECAADYLVTGDNDLLVLESFAGTPIVNAAAFLRIYGERAGD